MKNRSARQANKTKNNSLRFIVSAGLCLIMIGVVLLSFPRHVHGQQAGIVKADDFSSTQTLKTIIIDNYYPYTFVNDVGQPDGFTVDLMQAVAKAMDLQLEIKVDTWDNARHALENGNIDFLPMMAYSKERDKTYDFSAPHTIAYDAFFTRNNAPPINVIEDLQGKTIIVMKGDQAHDYLLSLNFIKPDQLILVDSLPQALQLLSSGTGDAALMPKLVGLTHIQKLGLTNLELSPAIVDAYNRPFSFAVKEGNQELLERLSQGLSIVKSTGQYNEIYNKWFGAWESQGISTAAALKYIGVIVLFFLLVWAVTLLWSLSLRKQVEARTKSLQMEIQERKQAEQALRENELIFSAFLEHSPVYVFFKDKEIRSLRLSKNYEQMLGMPVSEALGKSMNDLFPSELARSMVADDQRILNEGKVIKVVEELSGRTYETTKFPIFIDGVPNILAGFTIDITERKQSEMERERLLAKLRQKNEELEALVHIASHDMRSPLVTVQGFGNRLEKYCGQITETLEKAETLDDARAAAKPLLEEKLPNALRFIGSATLKMHTLVEGLLQLSRVGRMDVKMERLDMELLLQSVLSALAFQVQKANAQIHVEKPLAECYGDKNQINQIFTNLVDNAIKYRDMERPLVVTISSQTEGEKVIYTVADNGKGIAPEDHEKIWQIFRRADVREDAPGDGVGLALVHRIVERHGGRTWVESQAGVGSRFYMELPLSEL